jgi:polysaccharide export outer membrane protein
MELRGASLVCFASPSIQQYSKRSGMRAFAIAAARLALVLLAASFWLAAQETPAKPEAAPAQAKPEATEPAKTPLPVTVDPKTFNLGPEDIIYVRVWREPELSSQLVVRPDGKINMPLIREVEASGATPEQLAARITDALSQYLNNPQVLVQVLAVRSKRYTISGEILRPGAYPLAVPTTVFQAISLAGGFRDFASRKKIVIVRGDKRLRFNYNEVVKGKNLTQNILLENGDEIIVP